ncbi:MAG TPA: TlpA disulfide reductase family protein [Verrucomicrobiae bacterium]|nr:TlpA disulfide reductase family protein [Verrucomicrobiae bacterium]
MRPGTNTVVRRVNSASARKCAVVCVAAIGIAWLTAVSLAHGAEITGKDPAGASGEAAPDFALTNLAGKTVRLSDFKGKIVLLDFWATWCAPCQEEIPSFVQLQKQYSGRGFTVLGIALDDDGAAVVKPLAQKLDVNYPLVIGDTQVAARYGGIQAVPTAFLIGRDGRILKTFVGPRSKSEWEQTIQRALSPAAPGQN